MLTTFRASLRERGEERGSARGAPTDEQMDLLRAMLVFAGAGIDSMLKQLIRDAVPSLLEFDSAVYRELHTYATRRFRAFSSSEVSAAPAQFLASTLLSGDPRSMILDAYVEDLTGGSLQSPTELARSVVALGLQPSVFANIGSLGDAFDVRNQIVHELDINFDHPKRNRETRALGKMVELTNAILQAAAIVLALTDERIAKKGGA